MCCKSDTYKIKYFFMNTTCKIWFLLYLLLLYSKMSFGKQVKFDDPRIAKFTVFGNMEYEGLKSNISKDGDLSVKEWYYGLLANIERLFRLKRKTQGKTQVLYNFSSHKNLLYNSPWVFRLCFNVNKNY